MAFAFVVGQNKPTLNAASPASAQQGQQNVIVHLTGQNTHWTAGATTVTFGQGITVGAVSVSDATTLDAVISVDALASLGGRSCDRHDWRRNRFSLDLQRQRGRGAHHRCDSARAATRGRSSC